MSTPPEIATARYALYFRPPENALLTALGDRWLGRVPITGTPLPDPPVGIQPKLWSEWTGAPRLYGLHATLKPPFRLVPGTDRAALVEALKSFAATRHGFELPGLDIRAIGRFLALVPSSPAPEIDALSADCVRVFDRFRAHPDAAELARRRAAGLTPRQEEALVKWGYPYVLQDFRFHITLTGPLGPDALQAATAYLKEYFGAQLGRPVPVDGLCLFEQAAPGRPFERTMRCPFGRRTAING